jgi:hypothetical protein
MACGANCPCQCVKPKRRRARKSAPPRRNPVLDLLSALLVQKHQEGINKPPIYKPEMRSMSTSTESEKVAAEIVPRLQKPEVESPPLTSQLETAEAVPTLSSQLSELVKGVGRGRSSVASSRRGSMESVMTMSSDPGLPVGGAVTRARSGSPSPKGLTKPLTSQFVFEKVTSPPRGKSKAKAKPVERLATIQESFQQAADIETKKAREGGGGGEFIGLG